MYPYLNKTKLTIADVYEISEERDAYNVKEVIPQGSENGWLASVDKESPIIKFDGLLVFIAQTSE